MQQTRRGRRRQSAARTYLRPAKKRPNLQIVTGALVHRVLFDGRRAVGVEFSRDGSVERADAAREVILSAGAIGSPHILQLSGVGDPDHLGRIGIAVRHALPGVGKNFQDHILARVACCGRRRQDLNEKSRGLPFAGEVLRYLFAGHRHADLCRVTGLRFGQGAGGVGHARCADACFRHGSFAPGAGAAARRQARHDRRHVADAALVARLCRGEIARPGRAAGDQPALPRRGYRPALPSIGGLRLARRLFAAPALGTIRRGRDLPGRDVQSDDELLDYARQYGSTVFHATCTCKMGRDAMAVVDDRLRVHGLDGLRVIDASVMPAVTSTNTNAPTIMIAEKGAAMILADARQKLAA